MSVFILRRTNSESFTEFIVDTTFINSKWHCTWEENPGQVKVFYEHSSYTEIHAMYFAVNIYVERIVIG